jgi:hypothetical protein
VPAAARPAILPRQRSWGDDIASARPRRTA